MSAEPPVEYAPLLVPSDGAAVSDWHRPCACPQLVGPFIGKLTPLRNNRFAACGASTLVAWSVLPASPALVSAPVASGKNFFPTTPQAATMNKLNTGALLCAQAERSGSPSRKGRPSATPAPRSRLRRLTNLLEK